MTDSLTTVLGEHIYHRYSLAWRTQNWSADQKRGRKPPKQRLMNCQPLPMLVYFCYKNRQPLVVWKCNLSLKRRSHFKKKIVGRLMLCPLGQIKSFFPRRWPISSNARVVDFSVHQPTIIEWPYANSFVKSVLGQSPFTHLNFSLMKINQESTGLSGYRFWQIGKLMTDRIEFTLDI